MVLPHPSLFSLIFPCPPSLLTLCSHVTGIPGSYCPWDGPWEPKPRICGVTLDSWPREDVGSDTWSCEDVTIGSAGTWDVTSSPAEPMLRPISHRS